MWSHLCIWSHWIQILLVNLPIQVPHYIHYLVFSNDYRSQNRFQLLIIFSRLYHSTITYHNQLSYIILLRNTLLIIVTGFKWIFWNEYVYSFCFIHIHYCLGNILYFTPKISCDLTTLHMVSHILKWLPFSKWISIINYF